MNESLTGRVGRIISGSVNAVISAVENAAPDMIMEEAIREIDSAIDQVRQELGRTSATKHIANNRLMEENSKHEALSEQINTAVAEKREDLAEAGIAQQLDIEAQIPVLERAIGEAAEKEKELEGYIQALQAKKREMKTELKRFLETQQEADAVAAGDPQSSGSTVAEKVAKAESAFDRVLEKQTGLDSNSHSADATTAAKLAELEELSRQNRIKERLAALKAESQEA
ncbi:MAG: PspA/IM30 family protein [Chromatiales bacterium]|nr:PspA/IM30 family protein [Chromatiales bacterium]